LDFWGDELREEKEWNPPRLTDGADYFLGKDQEIF